MAVRSKSPKLFLERAGIRPTVPSPHPVYAMGDNPAHRLPLKPPLPIPEYVENTQGNPPPDRGVTKEWPYGTQEEP